jgi:hypothetical protein
VQPDTIVQTGDSRDSGNGLTAGKDTHSPLRRTVLASTVNFAESKLLLALSLRQVDMMEGEVGNSRKDHVVPLAQSNHPFDVTKSDALPVHEAIRWSREGTTNPQMLNRFSYALNNPLRYEDPTGHWTFGVGFTVTMGFFGAGAQFSAIAVVGSDWRPALAISAGGGGYTGFGVFLGPTVQVTTANSVGQLQDPSGGDKDRCADGMGYPARPRFGELGGGGT